MIFPDDSRSAMKFHISFPFCVRIPILKFFPHPPAHARPSQQQPQLSWGELNLVYATFDPKDEDTLRQSFLILFFSHPPSQTSDMGVTDWKCQTAIKGGEVHERRLFVIQGIGWRG